MVQRLAYQHVIDFLFDSTGMTHHGLDDMLSRKTAQNFTSCMLEMDTDHALAEMSLC
jgi:hypothetical protein